MSSQAKILKDEQFVLNFIKENINNSSFMSKLKDVVSNSDKLTVPDWQKKEVLNRLEEYNKNPDNVFDFDEAIATIEASL